MALGIICIIAGVIFGISSFVTDTNSAIQQTVQYLGFVCASLFIVGGLIMIVIINATHAIDKRLEKQDNTLETIARKLLSDADKT